jgi:hypothetical protein
MSGPRARTPRHRRPIGVVDRPFVITFLATNTTYPITAEGVRGLLAEYPPVSVSWNTLVLPGHNTPDPKQRAVVRPATLGGGPSFTW